MCPRPQPCLMLAGSCTMWWMQQNASVASLVNRLFNSSSELQITSIQLKHDSPSAKAWLHPLHMLFPGSSCGGCLLMHWAACHNSPGLHFSPCSSPALFVTLKSLLVVAGSPYLSRRAEDWHYQSALILCKICFLCSDFFKPIVVLIYNSFYRQYFLCQFDNFSQRFTSLLLFQLL